MLKLTKTQQATVIRLRGEFVPTGAGDYKRAETLMLAENLPIANKLVWKVANGYKVKAPEVDLSFLDD